MSGDSLISVPSTRRLLIVAGGALAAGLLLRAAAFEGIYIATPSMEPRLPVGAHLFLDKLTLRFREPRRGEIVCFIEPVPPGRHLVKRVIAVAGDAVEIRRKAVLLNGEPLSEPYAVHSRAGEALKGDDMEPIEVPRGHLFVLGDNRDESYDATTWKDPKTGEPVRFVRADKAIGLLRGFY